MTHVVPTAFAALRPITSILSKTPLFSFLTNNIARNTILSHYILTTVSLSDFDIKSRIFARGTT